THVGTLNDDSIDVEIEFDCTMLPIPNAAIAPNNANRIQSHLALSPCSRYYIGTADISPFELVTRYLTARMASPYFVAIPNNAESHIQNTAPGPPRTTAVATPTMLPVPMVAAIAVVRA